MEGDNNEENYEVAPKKIKTEWSKSYSNKAMQMMKRMGHKAGEGLGKQNQGRLEPVVPYQQDGRRGFGLQPNTIQIAEEPWDFNCEKIYLPETANWLSNEHNFESTFEKMKSWITFGDRKDTIEEETSFCEKDILTGMLEAKTIFDQFSESELRKARSRSNPFETIRSSIFQNRAAVKMANIDSMLGFMFTNPKDKDDKSLIESNDLMYFADICAGPGGFSEYVLYRKSWEAKGFGFTLRGPNDFKLDKFFAGPPESFDPHYGANDDGNIYVEANQESFADYVLKHCEVGVHIVMADGGFSVERQENIQELLSKQLYLCQCLLGLKILRPKGHFVCKFFDIFTAFSVGLIYLMYNCFEKISIIKPNSSRPANSERYLICKWKKENTVEICSHLNFINNILNQRTDDKDVLEIVDSLLLIKDERFVTYITNSNNFIGKNQIIGLKKIIAFCRNPRLREGRQSDFRKRCLELWNLPDKLRQAPENKPVDKFLEEFLNDWHKDKAWLNSSATELLSTEVLCEKVESIHDWYFMPIGRNESSSTTCTFFVCTTKGKLSRYTTNKKWESVEYIFEIPSKSFFYGELVYEYSGEGRIQTRVCTLHIIDAVLLGGKDIRRLPLNKRVSMCAKFAKSISKPYKAGNTALIRSKPIFKLGDISQFFSQMRHYTLKDNSQRYGIALNDVNTKFFVPGGIMLFCEICHNFYSKISKSQNKLYYYDTVHHMSYFKTNMPREMLNTLHASFRNSFIRRLLWKWTNTNQVEENGVKVDPNILYRDDVQVFVVNKHNV
uniref:Cap-specific mRNA (nucleoside-2'-O-)-methyltransferase 1 n=1 Tax=Glossina morsitans morsitans TaxID=37546 RepID=A0A1B0G4D2_GLOMM